MVERPAKGQAGKPKKLGPDRRPPRASSRLEESGAGVCGGSFLLQCWPQTTWTGKDGMARVLMDVAQPSRASAKGGLSACKAARSRHCEDCEGLKPWGDGSP